MKLTANKDTCPNTLLCLLTVQLNLKFTHMYQYMCISARLPCINLKILVCTSIVAYSFGMEPDHSNFVYSWPVA